LCDGGVLVEAENVVSKGAQSGEDARIDTDTAGVFAQCHVPNIMQTILDGPMSANGVRRCFGGQRTIGEIERGLKGLLPETGRRLESLNFAFDLNDRFDKRRPLGFGQNFGGIVDADCPYLMPVARFGVGRLNARKDFCGPAECLDLATQDQLVILELNDKMGMRCRRSFEGFFWQCMASQVTM